METVTILRFLHNPAVFFHQVNAKSVTLFDNSSMDRKTVFDTLSQSNAHLHDTLTLPSGSRLARWSNHTGLVEYHADQVHTLSLYTQGGEGTWRLDQKQAGHGQTGALCIIPEGQQSLWEIHGDFQFLHVYFSDAQFKSFVARTLDIEPRLLQVPDLTYQPYPELTQLLLYLNQSTGQGVSEYLLDADIALQEIFVQLARLHGEQNTRKLRITGGLSAYDKKKVKHFIRENLHESLTLQRLAQYIGLSEFHFARMFRQSFFQSVQPYIEQERIEYAKQLIPVTKSLADVALQCGFANQSHFSRVFKKHTQLTPKQYQRLK